MFSSYTVTAGHCLAKVELDKQLERPALDDIWSSTIKKYPFREGRVCPVVQDGRARNNQQAMCLSQKFEVLDELTDAFPCASNILSCRSLFVIHLRK